MYSVVRAALLFSAGSAIQQTAVPIEAHAQTSLAQNGTVARNKRGRKLLYIGINSAAADTWDREQVRNCWWNHELLKGEDAPVIAKFMVATPDPGSEEEKILNRDMAEKPDEFIQVDAPEGYYNLTKKVIAFYAWAANDMSADFYMKLDDNTFPDIGVMYKVLSDNLEQGLKYTYTGDMWWDGRANPWGKYAQDPEKWPAGKLYPEYVPGDGYILSAPLTKVVFKDHYDENNALELDNEDVNTGLWISNAVKDGVNVVYQELAERCDFSCAPIGSDYDRCCAADKSMDYSKVLVGN